MWRCAGWVFTPAGKKSAKLAAGIRQQAKRF
jgi:hypothetical protein